jgi:putative hemolysin
MNAIPELLTPKSKNRLIVELATTGEEILASQRLRYRVFAEELGAHLESADQNIDADRFDPHCHHLLVREADSRRIIGSTRLLTDELAAKAGGFYSQSEFELDSVLALPGRRLEVGRTCIDPQYRQGAAINALWSGLGAFILEQEIDWLFGCASIDLHDGGVRAHAIMENLRQNAMTPVDCRVAPKLALPGAPAYDPATVYAPLPPLLKAYVRLGARVAGEPCFDPDFKVADVLVLVDVGVIDQNYARHFLQRTDKVAPR